MRSRIVDSLNSLARTELFGYLVPDPAVVYAVMLAVGILIFVRRCGGASLSKYHASGLALWASVAGMIGARAFYLLQHAGDTFHNPGMILELNGATVSFGVYAGGTAGVLLYAAYHRLLPAWRYLDAAASVLGVGPMIGRLACFLNGDDFGTLSNAPWAVRFPHGSYPFLAQVETGRISPVENLSLPVHPVQLYESLAGLLLFVLFSILWRRNPFKPGALFFLYWIAYSSCRFVLEFFRGDDDRGWVGSFSTGQFMSMLFFATSLLCVAALYRSRFRRGETAATVAIPAPRGRRTGI